ncbi:MAG TPA: pitrilysin family protein [Candidatus Krumholzibacteria bacterium]|nr:pitrilysin family protein [Candidatus Krumholzibacteria bacterium]
MRTPKFTVGIATIFLAGMMMMIPGHVRTEPASVPSVTLPIKTSPLVTFRIQFRAGAIDDPAGKEGLTRLTASMLTDGGTRQHPYQEIVELLYPMAASINATVDKEVTTFYGTTHIENLDRYFELFTEMLLEPRFDERDFERVRASQVNHVSKTLRGADDEEFGKQSLGVMMYAGHPYGTPNAGVVSALESITLDDVEQHYARVFTRENAVIGLAGGYPVGLPDRIAKAIVQLPTGAAARGPLGTPSAIQNVEVLAVEKDCLATAISIGFPIDATRASADYYALLIANSYLGEHRTFNGRLMMRMREVRGLNYGDYSYIEHFVQDGGSTFPLTNFARTQQYFSIWIRPVQHQHRHFALRLAVFELERLVRDGMTQEEFERTRTFLEHYSKLWAQDQNRRLGYLMDSRFYGTDDYIATLPAKLDQVTLDQVNAAIRRHLNARNLRIAVITRGADDFLQDLITNKPSPMTYEAEGIPADVVSEDGVVAVYKLNVNREASKIMDAEEMFK